METVLIDVFQVPHEAMEPFLVRAQQAQALIKTLPGFVEGYVYEQRNGDAREHRIMTIAVWANEHAFEHAKRVVAEHNQRQGVNLQDIRAQLGIGFTRAEYTRSPY